MMSLKDFEAKQIVFVFLQQKEKLSFKNDNLVVTASDGKPKYQITCYRIFALFVVGHFVMTSGLIQRSHKFSFPVFLMTNSMKIYEMFGGHMEGNVVLRRIQYGYDSLEIGRHILENKLACQREVLNRQRNKSFELKEAIKKIDLYIQAIRNCEGDLEGLLGYEGSAARLYFKHHFNNIAWKGRKPRIKTDFVNSTLDIGYTILFNIIDALLQIYGFDTYCGVLHRQFYMRKSLVCDLIEPFRPIVDAQIRKAINLQQCKQEDFQIVRNQHLLKWECNASYVRFIVQGILEYKTDIFMYVQQFYRAMMKGKPADEFPVFKME